MEFTEITYEVNSDMTLTAIPVIVFIGLVSVVGLIGNAVVLNVYYRKYPRCNFRHFVLVLAGIDFISCLVLMPMEIVTLVKWFVFPNAWLCKIKSFLNAYTVTSSAATLLLIAIDRFRKVCRPHSKQIQPPCALKLTVLCLVLSLIPASSDAVFWGLHSDVTEFHGENVTIQMCEKDDKYKDTSWPVLHTLVLYGSTNTIVMLATMVLYILIAVKLFCVLTGPEQVVPRISVSTPLSLESDSGIASAKENVFKFPVEDIESGISESEDNIDSVDLSDVQCNVSDVTDDVNDNKVELRKSVTSENIESDTVKYTKSNTPLGQRKSLEIPLHETVTLRRKHHSGDPVPKKAVRISTELPRNSSARDSLQIPEFDIHRKIPSNRQGSPKSPVSPGNTKSLLHRRRSTIASLPGHKGTRLRRKTLIMFILTAAFVGTTLLYFTLIGYMSRSGNYMSTLNHSERSAWMFFLRLYFINSVLNPILYGFLDPRFRKALWNMGVHISWVAGSLKKNLATSIRRSSSGRSKNELSSA